MSSFNSTLIGRRMVAPVRYFRITTASAVGASDDSNGNPTQWVYQCQEIYKAAAGYDQWTDTPAGQGYSGSAYNFIEDQNDGSGRQGNGIKHGASSYPSGFQMRRCPMHTRVAGVIVPTPSGSETMFEMWFSYVNSEDGDCD